MSRPFSRLLLGLLLGVAPGVASAQFVTSLYSENFDSLTPSLGASVNERLGRAFVTRVATDAASQTIPNAFSKTGPAGWTVNNNLSSYQGAPTVGNAGVPGQGIDTYGVDEWEGWSFANKNFWFEKDDQGRSGFTNASGTIAVVDPDEYFDLGGTDDAVNGGFYNSSLVSPSIATAPGIYTLSFDSSWLPESLDDDHRDPAFSNLNTQAVEIVAVYDNGVRQTRAAWDSVGPANPGDPIPTSFKPDAPNERLSYNFGIPSGATSVRFEFNLANAANDWWWAIDNLSVANLSAGGATVWAENFESVALGESVNERITTGKVTRVNTDPASTPVAGSFTHTAPTGWSVDNAGTPSLGDDNVGVFEWEGWSFATPEFWTFADRSGRESFSKGTGVIAIADGDEWDDLGNPDAGGTVSLKTLLESPVVNVPALGAGDSLGIAFDSSWRAEDGQVATLLVSLDGATPTEIFRWESDDTSANFKADATNESVLYTVDATGASTAQFFFQYSGADDWWWAIDNVQVGVVPEPSSLLLLTMVGAFAASRRR